MKPNRELRDHYYNIWLPSHNGMFHSLITTEKSDVQINQFYYLKEDFRLSYIP